MNCPYCNHILTLKELKQGLYGKCPSCRFAGYLPSGKVAIRLAEGNNKVTGRLAEGNNKVTGRLAEGNNKVTDDEDEDEEMERWISLAPECCKKYKTEGGLLRHLQQVKEEKEEHPIVYKKHDRHFGSIRIRK